MGKRKDEGIPAAALMEECAEVIQVIAKAYRFGGDWDEIPPTKTLTRWQELQAEMADVIYQWERLQREREQSYIDDMMSREYECKYGTLHPADQPCECYKYTQLLDFDNPV